MMSFFEDAVGAIRFKLPCVRFYTASRITSLIKLLLIRFAVGVGSRLRRREETEGRTTY